MSTLREIVAAQTAMAEELPLVHTTRCEILDRIMTSHELRGGECDVFHENLVYFFYGRPAYRHRHHHQPGGGVELCPVCLVFKPHTVGSGARRVFPCDSGGVHGDRFAPHLTRADLAALELEPSVDSARRLVALVFGTNLDYFNGRAAMGPPGSFAPDSPAQRYHNLLRDRGSLAGDDRRSAVEVQAPSPVALDHHLLYVILPREQLDRPDVRRVIFEVWQCDPIPYDGVEGTAVNECVVTIRDALRRRLQEGTRL